MSRRLKKSRTVKLTGTANLPRLDGDGLDGQFARTFARKRPSLRASLMVGTAIGAGFITTLLVDTQGAIAGTCTPSGSTLNCTGTFPTISIPGIFATNPPYNTINVTTATVGANIFGDGVTLLGYASPETLTVTTDSATTIGVGANYAVTRDGIHVYSHYNDTSIVINNQAQIGEAGQPVGRYGIYGHVRADASASYLFSNAYGGIAYGSVTIANYGAITSASGGISGYVNASANASSVFGNAFGGIAGAYVTISNSAAITSGGDGIYGGALAYANATSLFGNAYGGIAIASVTISNSAPITSNGEGIDGFAYASAGGSSVFGNAFGGIAGAYVTISNSGPITSSFDGIAGFAGAYADASSVFYNAFGGIATASVTIGNSGAITSNSDGIDGFARADAGASSYFGNASGGIAGASVTISNSGGITSTFDGIYGGARAYANANTTFGSAYGGIATAGVAISNTAAIASSNGDGINGFSLAEAEASGYHATGGIAGATTTIYNAGPIHSRYDGIYGGAVASADAFGTSTAIGGTATATVIITNTGSASIYSKGSSTAEVEAIEGISGASASAFAYTATGGTATAQTDIYNAGNLVAVHTIPSEGALFGQATASANGEGSDSALGLGIGGTASATVTITNSGAIAAGYGGPAIQGRAKAYANGSGATAIGGTATATTEILNTGNLQSFNGDGIVGYAKAEANHGSSPNYSYATNVGIGGVATASVLIVNNANIVALYGNGITGTSIAEAEASGYTAIGGTATADTTIINFGRINSDTGIGGYAFADASGHSFYAGVEPSVGIGGTATATVAIGNFGNITAIGPDGFGIVGDAEALANGYGHIGIGGVATAYTQIYNNAKINSTLTGIVGAATAEAFGAGSYNILGGAAGGIATATVTITNKGNINSGGGGIYGYALAEAGGYGTGGVGGTATATTTIFNSGTIVPGSGYTAIKGVAEAYASGRYQGGSALAYTNVTNAGIVHTNYTFGILAVSKATANAYASYGFAGYAKAITTVLNAGAITTTGDDAPGIGAASAAFATGNVGAGLSGVAIANTFVTNTGTIETLAVDDSPGIAARSLAIAGNYSSGYAFATTGVYNHGGTISTIGTYSPGVAAASAALSGGLAFATTLVTNSGRITTSGDYSPGIAAASLAAGFTAPGNVVYDFSSTSPLLASLATSAFAITQVVNSGVVETFGFDSPAVLAGAFAAGSANAVATIIVNNSGDILTHGLFSDAIDAAVVGGAGSSITVNNAKSGNIIAYDFPYHAVVASGAPTTINNAGLIRGNVYLNKGNPAFTNTFNNTGEWVMVGDSHFGGNIHTALNNIGTATSPTDVTCDRNGCVTMLKEGSTIIASPDAATPGAIFYTVTLHGLETFNNDGGLVTMINGQPNDRIVIENNVGKQVYFNGTGNSQLGVDAFLGGPGSQADVLQVGGRPGQGYVTGLTHIVVNDTNPGPGAFNPVGIPVAESGGAAGAFGGTANIAGNFDLPQGPIQKGLFEYDLFFLPKNAANDPCGNGFNCWFLASTPNTAALELPRLMTAANDIFRNSSGMWLDRTADLRDYYFFAGTVCGPNGGGADMPVKARPPACVPQPGGAGPGVWFRAFGDWTHNNGNDNVSAFNRTLSHDVSYHQTTGGAQIGADFAVNGLGYNPILFGVLGGAIDSTVNFNNAGGSAHFRGGNAGAYATYLNQGFFFDTLFLAQIMNLDFTSAPFGFSVNGGDVTQVGGHIDTGYRFQFNPWFVEPQATLEIAHSQFDKFNLPAVFATTADLDNNWVAGRLGARVGGTWFGSGWRWEPSLTGGVWYDFTGNNVATLTSNGFVTDVTDNATHRTTGEVGGMLNAFQVGGGWSAFVKGDYRFASGFSSGLVTGGFRYQWGSWPIAWGGH